MTGAHPATVGERPARRLRDRVDRTDVAVTVALVVGVLVLVAFRLFLSLHRTGPVVNADEIGYLINTRVLTGGEDGYLTRANIYAGGYSLALVPAYLLGDGPEATYRLVLGTNAVLVAVLLPLLYLALRHVFGIAVVPALLCSLAGALFTPVSVLSEMALSENLLVPLVMIWFLLLVAYARARTALWSTATVVLSGVATAWLYATHNRMIPVIAIQLGVLGLLAARRHVRVWTAAGGGLVVVAGALAAQRLNTALYDASWPDKVDDQGQQMSRALSNLFSVDGAPERLQYMDGEITYLAIASFGLVVIGVVALLRIGVLADRDPSPGRRELWRRGGTTGLDADRARVLGAWVLLLVLAGLVLITGISTTDEFGRPDHRIYGRYVEIVAPVLLALGLAALTAWLPTRLPRWVLAVVAAATTGAATLLLVDGADEAFDATNIGWANITGLIAIGDRTVVDPAGRAVVSLCLLAGVALLSARAVRLLAVAGVCGVLVWSTVHADRIFMEPRQGRYYPTTVTVDDFPEIRAAEHVVYDSTITSEAEFVYQHYLDGTTLALFDSRLEPPPPGTEVVLARDDWTDPDGRPARRVWHDPVFGVTAWSLSPS